MEKIRLLLGKIPLIPLLLIAVFLGLAPFSPEPHLSEKVKMLLAGNLNAPMDIFDLLMHSAPAMLLLAKLGLGKTEPNSRHVIIIATVREKTTGFLVDSVSDILTVGSSDLQPPPQIVNSTGNQFIKGILSLEDTILRFIDVTCIVDNETS